MAPPVTASGITTDKATGERHIPSSTRPDGSQRREIRVRPGYMPPEDVERYKNRAAAAFKNRGSGGVPGAEGLKSDDNTTTPTTAASNKNAKKREAKRRAKAEAETEAGEENVETESCGPKSQPKKSAALEKDNWRTSAPEKSTQEATEADIEAENEKKARNLKKKLRQARDLRDKKDKGENLLPEQLEKVIKIQELIRQLDSLGFDANGEPKNSMEADTAATTGGA
jgi:partner of Y14 and mago protein